jgi:uncharacterized membrane protein
MTTLLIRRRPRVALTGIALAGAAALAVAAPAAAASSEQSTPRYVLTDLGALPGGTASFALGVSPDGAAVGTSRTGTGSRPQLAVRWRDGHVENLGTLPGSTFSRAFEVNGSGQAVGEAFTAPPETSRAVLWEADGTLRDLGTLGGPSAVANAIDERGRAFGVSSQASGPSVATVWERTGPRALPAVDPGASGISRVNAVTTSGRAVGSAPARTETGSTVGVATRWDPRGQSWTATALERLESGRFATAYGVSENGTAVGEATRLDPTDSAPARTSTRAVRWDGTRVTELPAVGSYRFTRANEVANRGDVVGHASGFAGFPTIDGVAVLWRGDRAVDLNTAVVGGTDGFVLRTAESVNDAGQIVGFGSRDGQTGAFLLTPVE